MSNIEWTDVSWNPVAGCTRVSPGCDHCYAYTMTKRLAAMGQEKYRGLAGKGHFNGVVRTVPSALGIPLRRRKPTMYFVNSMSDLFHGEVPDDYIAAVFGVMAATPQHTFQVLTKRPERALEWFEFDAAENRRGSEVVAESAINLLHSIGFDTGCGAAFYPEAWPLPNVWIGVSVEDQQRADERIPLLLQIPAAVRFLSCEPLLGPVDISPWIGTPVHVDEIGARESPDRNLELEEAVALAGGLPMQDPWINPVGWVIVGGESGHGARPCRVEWIREVVELCRDAAVPCFVKQVGSLPAQRWGDFDPEEWGPSCRWRCADSEWDDTPVGDPVEFTLGGKGGQPSEWPEDLRVREFPA